MKELIRFDDETQRTFLKEVSGLQTSPVLTSPGSEPFSLPEKVCSSKNSVMLNVVVNFSSINGINEAKRL